MAASFRSTRIAYRSDEVDETEENLRERESTRYPLLSPCPRHALGEVGEDEHARPLEGVALSTKHARNRKGERQRLERHQGAARPQRREPQLPGEAESDQRDERQGGGESKEA